MGSVNSSIDKYYISIIRFSSHFNTPSTRLVRLFSVFSCVQLTDANYLLFAKIMRVIYYLNAIDVRVYAVRLEPPHDSYGIYAVKMEQKHYIIDCMRSSHASDVRYLSVAICYILDGVTFVTRFAAHSVNTLF